MTSLFDAAGVPETVKSGGLPKWWPVCAACGRPIARMSWTCGTEDPPRTRFVAECHGMSASVIVPRHQAAAGGLLVEVPRGP